MDTGIVTIFTVIITTFGGIVLAFVKKENFKLPKSNKTKVVELLETQLTKCEEEKLAEYKKKKSLVRILSKTQNRKLPDEFTSKKKKNGK